MMLDRARLEQLLAGIRHVRVAVVGDYCLDAYWTADMTRSELSRETPHYPLPIVAERYAPGGAGNVAVNVRSLGAARVEALTVLGQDWRRELLEATLREAGVGLDLIVATDKTWVTPAYIKPIRRGYAAEQEDARLDFSNQSPLEQDAEAELLGALRAHLPTFDAVLICDQLATGTITPKVRAVLNELAQERPGWVCVVDSRARMGEFRGMILKPNELEAARALGEPPMDGTEDMTHIAALGGRLAQRAGRPVCITLGSRGAIACAGEDWTHVPAVRVEPPIDIVGAGDTFLSALGSALAAGATVAEAAALGNLAAAVTVKKLNQTGTASPDEIRRAFVQWEAQR